MSEFINKNFNFFGFDYGEKGNTILLTIIMIILISFMVYIFKLLFIKRKINYHSNEFWESRYSLYEKEMDWYINYKKICEDFKLDFFLNELLPLGKKSKILELGCGNSTLASDLYDNGYKNISALDFSITVIEKMKAKYTNKSIKCKPFFIQKNYLSSIYSSY